MRWLQTFENFVLLCKTKSLPPLNNRHSRRLELGHISHLNPIYCQIKDISSNNAEYSRYAENKNRMPSLKPDCHCPLPDNVSHIKSAQAPDRGRKSCHHIPYHPPQHCGCQDSCSFHFFHPFFPPLPSYLCRFPLVFKQFKQGI